jgi:hypothetical protein
VVNEPEQASGSGPTRRAVILGASNIALGLSTIIDTVGNAWGRPVEIMVAAGHGRSYGVPTSILGRGLLSISECRLWQDLETAPPLPTAALVTDIGNDVIFGYDAKQIIRWLDDCLARLSTVTDRLVITRLPLESLQGLSPLRYRLVKSLYFPRARIDVDRALGQVQELNAYLTECAHRYRAYVVHPDPRWYGWDPIHIRRDVRAAAWQRVLSCWSDGRMPPSAKPSLRRWFKTLAMRPLDWSLFGFPLHNQQPSGRLPDGSTIWLY